MNDLSKLKNLPSILEAAGCSLQPSLALAPDFQLPLRETHHGDIVPNMCARDFLWLCLHRQNPDRWNLWSLPPAEVTRHGIFGPDVSPILGYHLSAAAEVLAKEGLAWWINGYPVGGYQELVAASICRGPYRAGGQAIERIRDLVSRGVSCGINLPVGWGGLMTHVVFVAGFTGEGLVVFDTHNVSRLGYRKLTPDGDPRCAMLLPFAEVNRRWGRFARVFEVHRVRP